MKLTSIQSLRALAAFAVMLGHLRSVEAKHSGETALLSEVWVNGASGVDLFFVISGFIMVWVAGEARRGPGTAGAFLFARVSRIYPLWWLFAGAMAAYFLVAYGVPWDAANLERVGLSGPEHLARSFALLPQPTFPVLGVGWTLVHEVYFYVVFAALLMLPARFLPAALAMWAALVIAGSLVGLSGSFADTIVNLIFYPMTLEFILGAVAALVIRNGIRVAPAAILAAGCLAFVAGFVIFRFDGTFATLGWGRVLVFGLPSVLIVYGLVCLEVDRGLAMPGFMVALGDWSYALYLCHMLVLSAVARIYFALVGGPGIIDNIGFNLIASAASVAVAALTFMLFERPVLRLAGRARAKLFATSNSELRPKPVRARVW